MTGVPARELAALVGPSGRGIRWTVPVTMTVIALALVLRHLLVAGADASSALWTVRSAALLLVIGALVAFDDPAATQVAASPLPLCWRTAPRLLFSTALVLTLVAGFASLLGAPGGDLTLEAGSLLSVGAAACLTLARTGAAEPSLPVSAGLLLLAPALQLLPDRIALLVPPGELWTRSHLHWTLLLGVALVVLAVALRDPASAGLPGTGRGVRRA
jgi:hypothetical protein